MWASLSVWLLSLLSVGLLVHQHHLHVENKAQGEEILHLQSTIVQLQEEKQHLRGQNQYLQEEKQHLQEDKQQLQKENQYLQEEKQRLQEEKQHLQEDKQQLQKENQYLQEEKQRLQEEKQYLQEEKQRLQKDLQDGSSTWNKVVFCVTTAHGVTSVVAGIAGGAVRPATLYQAATSLLYYIFGIDLSTSIPKIAGP